jgi:uncharacterized protein YbjT (DUF2867 family)
MYVVLGASGNTGHIVAQNLLARQQKVRVVGRDAAHLQAHAAKGAEIFIADVTDAAALTKAFQNADSAYVMIPPNPTSIDPLAYAERVSDAIASALKNGGVKNVVVLSSFGADKSERTGPVLASTNSNKNSTSSTVPTYSFCAPATSWKTPCRKLMSSRTWASPPAPFALISNFR